MLIPLKSLRESRKMTQQELSRALQISPSAIGMYETGRRSPDYETLKKIARLFNVSVDYLLGNETRGSNLSSDEMDLVRGYRRLDNGGQNVVWQMIDQLSRAVKRTPAAM